jgi:putative Ca2+/H+ antiporter (TMEM165/GDT1 family)
MDYRVFGVAFMSILFAELADKTQLIGITLSAKSGRPLSVWLGSVIAYMLVTIVTVLIGAMLSKCIKEEVIRYAGAVIFILIGLLMLWGKI